MGCPQSMCKFNMTPLSNHPSMVCLIATISSTGVEKQGSCQDMVSIAVNKLGEL